MILLMSLFLLVTPSLASEVTPIETTLTVKGFYLKAACVEYQVFEVEGEYNTLLESNKSFKAYKLELTVGKSYMILFTKDDLTKTLYITPTEGGKFELDVCMSNDQCAELNYDPGEKTYKVDLITSQEYAAKAH